jgi:excisionase family DNA binding protein
MDNGLEQRMLTTCEVSKWLGIAPRTVCTWAECQELPGIKVGRQWRFRRGELLRWLERSRRKTLHQNHLGTSAAAAAAAAYHFTKGGV